MGDKSAFVAVLFQVAVISASCRGKSPAHKHQQTDTHSQ